MNKEQEILESRNKLIDDILHGDNLLEEGRKKKPVGLVTRIMNKFGYSKVKTTKPTSFGQRLKNAASALTGYKQSVPVKTRKPKTSTDSNTSSVITKPKAVKVPKVKTASVVKIPDDMQSFSARAAAKEGGSSSNTPPVVKKPRKPRVSKPTTETNS